MLKVPPWERPSAAQAPPQGAPHGSLQLGAPRERPAYWAPSLGCSSEPPPKPPISPPFTTHVTLTVTLTLNPTLTLTLSPRRSRSRPRSSAAPRSTTSAAAGYRSSAHSCARSRPSTSWTWSSPSLASRRRPALLLQQCHSRSRCPPPPARTRPPAPARTLTPAAPRRLPFPLLPVLPLYRAKSRSPPLLLPQRLGWSRLVLEPEHLSERLKDALQAPHGLTLAPTLLALALIRTLPLTPSSLALTLALTSRRRWAPRTSLIFATTRRTANPNPNPSH